jgi:hypothetical protein
MEPNSASQGLVGVLSQFGYGIATGDGGGGESAKLGAESSTVTRAAAIENVNFFAVDMDISLQH